MVETFLDAIQWNQDGLVPVITQEATSKRVLTHAWVNRAALSTAIDEQRAVYWSRSRAKLWRKGEESGNVQKLVDVFLDCDNDSLCYLVKQVGDCACHTGRESCFYRRLVDGQWETVDPVLTDPTVLYGDTYQNKSQ